MAQLQCKIIRQILHIFPIKKSTTTAHTSNSNALVPQTQSRRGHFIMICDARVPDSDDTYDVPPSELAAGLG